MSAILTICSYQRLNLIPPTLSHPCSYANAIEWKAKKANFYQENEDMKNATRELIDTSFRKLRSAEGACDLLQSFKSIKSKGAIQKQVMNKFNDILEQFSRELDR